MLVLDYSAGQPGAAAIQRTVIDGQPVIGAVRYIGFPNRKKCTTAGELRDFTAHGLGMALVYEDNADDWRGGLARGREAGARARSHATAIGFPADRPIYMAIDRDVVSAVEFAVMVEYLRGAAQSLGGLDQVGVYGEFDVCIRAQQAGVATYFWQCRAWSGTPPRLFAARDLYQRVGTVQVGGIGCDINDVLQPDWGQHTTENDMQPTDLVIDPATGQPALDTNGNTYSYNQAWYYTNLSGWVLREGLDDLKAKQAATQAAVAAIANDQDITPDELAAVVDRAVAEHTPTAEQVAAAQLPHIADAVREVLGEDNADQAAAIVDALAERLRPTGV